MVELRTQVFQEVQEQIMVLLSQEKLSFQVSPEKFSEPFNSKRLEILSEIEPLEEGYLIVNKK